MTIAYLHYYKHCFISYHKDTIYAAILLLLQQISSCMLQYLIVTAKTLWNWTCHLKKHPLTKFYSITCTLSSVLQNDHCAAHMLLHAAASSFLGFFLSLTSFAVKSMHKCITTSNFYQFSYRYNICCNFIAAAASMQQYAAIQHFLSRHCLELWFLP